MHKIGRIPLLCPSESLLFLLPISQLSLCFTHKIGSRFLSARPFIPLFYVKGVFYVLSAFPEISSVSVIIHPLTLRHTIFPRLKEEKIRPCFSFARLFDFLTSPNPTQNNPHHWKLKKKGSKNQEKGGCDLNENPLRKEPHLLLHYSMIIVVTITLSFLFHGCVAGLLSEPAQPLKPGDYNTVPAFPVQTEAQTCRLDLSAELFGGVSAACGRNLDRSRCCPVLAAWLFAAHARSALQVPAGAPPAGSDLPMMPDDSQKCVNTLQSSLQSRNIHIPQPNASCDAVLCFCGIRLHQITSLSCPAAFNITGNYKNATPTAAVRNLEHSCKNSSYTGCTNCLGALQKLKGNGKNGTKEGEDRASKMLSRDCQLMGLTWLLARNKTAYIPTVSAVLRAIMYSAHTQSTCSPDQENMPLAVDSLQLEKYDSSSSSFPTITFIPVLPLIILGYLFVWGLLD